MESQIYTYLNDNLAFRSVASRSCDSQTDFRIILKILKKPKGGPSMSKKFSSPIPLKFHMKNP